MPMPALPFHHHRPALQTRTIEGANAALVQRWGALQRRADEIAALADLAPEFSASEKDAARIALGDAFSHACERAAQIATRGIEDMELLTETGLKALVQVQARGKPVQAPALALWRELYHAREAVLSVLEPVPA